jgi:hypothetical protein
MPKSRRNRKRKRSPEIQVESDSQSQDEINVLSDEDASLDEEQEISPVIQFPPGQSYSHGCNQEDWRKLRDTFEPMIIEAKAQEEPLNLSKLLKGSLEAITRKINSAAVRELSIALLALANRDPPRLNASKKQMVSKINAVFPSLLMRGFPITALLPTLEALHAQEFPEQLAELAKKHPPLAPKALNSLPLLNSGPQAAGLGAQGDAALDGAQKSPLGSQNPNLVRPLNPELPLAAKDNLAQQQAQELTDLKIKLLRNKLEVSVEVLRKQRLKVQARSAKNGLDLLKCLILQRFRNPVAVPVRLEALTSVTFNKASQQLPAGAELAVKPKVLDPHFEVAPKDQWISSHAEAIEALQHHDELHMAHVATLPEEQQAPAEVALAGVRQFHKYLIGGKNLVTAMGEAVRSFEPAQIHEIFNLVVMNLGNGQFRQDSLAQPSLFDRFERHPQIQQEVLKILVRPGASKPGGSSQQASSSKKAKSKAPNSSPSPKKAEEPASTKKIKAHSQTTSHRSSLSPAQKARGDFISKWLLASPLPDVKLLCRNFHSYGAGACKEPCPRPHECPVCPNKAKHSLSVAKHDNLPAHKALGLPPA